MSNTVINVEEFQVNKRLYATKTVQTANFVTFTEEILNEKLHFLHSVTKKCEKNSFFSKDSYDFI